MQDALLVTLAEPVQGWWDGGKKERFIFTLGREFRDTKGVYQRIEGYDANYWFHVAKGKTDKATLANAWRHLRSNFTKNGFKVATHWYIENPYK